jgi:PAS domain S-box-containing protein
MTPDTASSPLRELTQPARDEDAAKRPGPLAPPTHLLADRRWLLALVGGLLLHIGQPIGWHGARAELGLPALGVGLALVAWLGPRALLLVAITSLTATAQAWLLHLPLGDGAWSVVVNALFESVLEAGSLYAIWAFYRRLRHASWSLGDFRSAGLLSAIVFAAYLLLAAIHALYLQLTVHPDAGFLTLSVHTWLAWSLGVLTVAPPLLIVGTRLLPPLSGPVDPAAGSALRAEPEGARRWSSREWVEGALVCMGCALLGLLGFGIISSGGEARGWQWLQLPWLVVGWAALCHGAQKGLLAAAATAGLPLLLLTSGDVPGSTELGLQVLLLTPLGVALLAGLVASRNPKQETPYREIVRRLPVVLYNARVTRAPVEGRPPGAEILFVSPACKDLLGHAPDDLLGDYEYWLRHVHPEDREVLLAALAQAARQSQPVICEYRLASTIAVHPRPAASVITPPSRSLTGTGSRIIRMQQQRADERWLRDTIVPELGRSGELVGWQGVVTDITEQRHLADDLRQTTGMFHALVANLPAGVFFVQGPSGRPILVNARARQLLGQREDPAAGLQHFVETYRLHRPDGSPYPVEELPVTTALRRAGTTMRDDIVVHRPDGRRIPLITWAAPIDLAGKGEPDAAVWVFEDLSALRQAESALRESESYLRAVIGTMVEALVVQDHSGVVVECNRSAAALFGVSADQLLGRSLLSPEWSYLREDGVPLPAEEHPTRVVLATGQPVRDAILAVKVPPGDGTLDPAIHWLLVNALPLPGREAGAGVVTTFTDITAHRHALEVLRASEEKYRGLVETLPIMLCQLDRDGQFTYVNPVVEAVTGYDLDDLREPERWLGLIHPDDRAAAAAGLQEILSGQTVRREFRFRARDGSERIAYSIGQPQWQGGRVVGLISLIVDVTRERRLEHELQRAQRLELIGRLSSGIAHDFNNLLTVILTLAELAKTTLPVGHPTQEELKRIANAGQQAANLANQLLSYSKQKPMQPRPVDLNRVARRALDLLRATWPASIAIETALGDNLPLLEGDEWQLQQVLMNLCLNARDAMPDGGHLKVGTEERPAPDRAGLGWIVLSVHDDGCGMTEEVKTRIFDPFFTTKEIGSGLGLAVVHQIVTAHGGRIEVDTKLRQGTRFEVLLPRTQTPGLATG